MGEIARQYWSAERILLVRVKPAAGENCAQRNEVIDVRRPVLTDETGIWIADYARLRFHATRAR
jgi:hypothetical protein